MASLTPSQNPPLVITNESIADSLRADILRGNLKSGQALKQDEIAAQFGISKIPVREALVQLKTEGLVNFYHNRGAFVSEISAAEADEIYVMRIALETAVNLIHRLSKNHVSATTGWQGYALFTDQTMDHLQINRMLYSNKPNPMNILETYKHLSWTCMSVTMRRRLRNSDHAGLSGLGGLVWTSP